MYIKAGPEIAVATTKAFTAQCALLSLLAFKMASDKKLLSEEDKKNIINSFYSIGDDADNLLNNASSSKKTAEKIIYFS